MFYEKFKQKTGKIDMNKKESENCWEFMDCPEEVRDNCPAYKLNKGRMCWAVAAYVEKGCPKLKRDFEYCHECPWFKKCNNSSPD